MPLHLFEYDHQKWIALSDIAGVYMPYQKHEGVYIRTPSGLQLKTRYTSVQDCVDAIHVEMKKGVSEASASQAERLKREA